MAARLRCQLFAAVIVQDIAFFDANKTGEIVNRHVTALIFALALAAFILQYTLLMTVCNLHV